MIKNIKDKFPVFKKNHDLIFLDTAASALKPESVIKTISDCYAYEYSNIHRGLYSLSSKLTKKFEDVRIKTSKFISAKSEKNIIVINNKYNPEWGQVPFNYLPMEFKDNEIIFNHWRELIKSSEFTLGPYIETELNTNNLFLKNKLINVYQHLYPSISQKENTFLSLD